MQKLLDGLIDVATISLRLKKLLVYAATRTEGFQHGSYGLKDEVALALSFVCLARGGVVIDAGANKGDWSQIFLVSDVSFEKLILIEPQSVYASHLQQISDLNPRVLFEPVAIGSEPGILTLYSDQAGSTLASFYQRDVTHIGVSMTEQEVVSVTTLDELAKQHVFNRIAFVKLDLEGHELEALKGAKSLLENNSIDALTFEFGGTNIDSRTFIKDFWAFLVQGYGFKLYRLLPGHRLKRLSKYSESLENFNWQNILACAPGISPTWKVLD